MASIERTKIITRSHSSFCPSRGTLDFNEVTGAMEWGQKSKPPKIPSASNKNPKTPWTNIKHQTNSMPNFQKVLNYITRKIELAKH